MGIVPCHPVHSVSLPRLFLTVDPFVWSLLLFFLSFGLIFDNSAQKFCCRESRAWNNLPNKISTEPVTLVPQALEVFSNEGY